MTTWYFDMDGTLADLYNSSGWLEKLENEQGGVFDDLKPLIDLERFKKWCEQILAKGDRIEIITWLPRGASDEYMEDCAIEKMEWVAEKMPWIKKVHCQPYGTPKQYAIEKRSRKMILVDDNTEVIQMWQTTQQRVGIVASEFWKMI